MPLGAPRRPLQTADARKVEVMGFYLHYDDIHLGVDYSGATLDFYAEEPKRPLFLVDGPWLIPFKTNAYVAVAKEMQGRMMDTAIRTNLQHRFKELESMCWGPLTGKHEADLKQRDQIKQWLDEPACEFVFYSFTPTITLPCKTPLDAIRFDSWGSPEVFNCPQTSHFSSILRYDISKADDVRVTEADIEQYHLPQDSRVKPGTCALNDALQRWKDHIAENNLTTPFISDERFKTICRVFYEEQWRMEDELSKYGDLSMMAKWNKWERAADRVFECLTATPKRARERLAAEGIHGLESNLFTMKLPSDKECADFNTCVKSQRGVELDEAERTNWESVAQGVQGCHYREYWERWLSSRDENGQLIEDDLLKHLGALNETHLAKINKEYGPLSSSLKLNRNPSRSKKALKLGQDCEQFILKVLEMTLGVSGKEDASASTFPSAFQRWLERDHAKITLEGIDKNFLGKGLIPPSEIDELPDEFFHDVGSRKVTPHLDVLFAHMAGALDATEPNVMTVRTITVIVWEWIKINNVLAELKHMQPWLREHWTDVYPSQPMSDCLRPDSATQDASSDEDVQESATGKTGHGYDDETDEDKQDAINQDAGDEFIWTWPEIAKAISESIPTARRREKDGLLTVLRDQFGHVRCAKSEIARYIRENPR
jgi:hypothetical protein